MMPEQTWQPLAGIKVVDFSIFLPGPLTGQMLADMGAEVIKVESPAGDPARSMMPDLFNTVNRGKRSVVLDLKDEHAKSKLEQLANWADIVIEGFRPGVAKKLGISYADLSQFNTRLIYCSISGYGQTGSWNNKPGHDLNYLAAAGALGFAGSWNAKPARSSLPIADISGTGFALAAILAALHELQNSATGRYLDLSLFESTLFHGVVRHGIDSDVVNRAHLYPGNDYFETGDGHILALGLLEDHFWRAFCEKVSSFEPAVLAAKYSTVAERRTNGDDLTALLTKLVASLSKSEWLELLSGSDIPYEFAVLPGQAIKTPHVQERKRVKQANGKSYMPMPVTVDGCLYPGTAATAPALGEYTAEFLGD